MKGGALRQKGQSVIREIVFGMEDALVSTLGALTGIAAGTGSTFVVILSGVVLIFAEALSMTAGSYLSSKSAREVYELRKRQNQARLLQRRNGSDVSLAELLKRKGFTQKEVHQVGDIFAAEQKEWLREMERHEKRLGPSLAPSPVRAAGVMGIFYLFGGIFPLAPYLFLPVEQAMFPSIGATAFVLFILGWWKAKMTDSHVLRSALEMTTVSLSAAVLGFFLGRLVSAMF